MQRDFSMTHRGLLYIEGWVDGIFTHKYNPLYYLGAIAVFLMWVLLITGVYLLIYYKISVGHAYESIQYLTEEQWLVGGVIRSLHRYASDALIVVVVTHLLRVFVTDKYRLWRWLPWVSGVVILIVLLFTGILGYWMVWDERAQLIAVMTSEMLDYIPVFTGLLKRAFLTNDTVTGLLFFLIIFTHIVVPLWLFFIVWVHVTRISRPIIYPPRAVSVAIVFILIVLAALKPALSTAPADLARIPFEIPIDWFYLFFFPLYEATSPGIFWVIVTTSTLLLFAVPLLGRTGRLEKAEIIPDSCVGCEQCDDDCPYEAIYMKPDDTRERANTSYMKAAIIPRRCAGCGICIGSCDYRAVRLGEWTDVSIKEEISRMFTPTPAQTSDRREAPTVLGILCAHSVETPDIVDPETKDLKDMPGVKVMTLPCIGMILPSMIEHALEAGADGVFICGCRMGDCHYREGNKWLEQRLLSERQPAMRKPVDPLRVRVLWLSATEAGKLLREVGVFLDSLGQESLGRGGLSKKEEE
jgi:coenzyme F420-reducing hydrogenase delta subunit/Pyruvate/2-oxoacid:ferredoxin oxidoreductase delta subunit